MRIETLVRSFLSTLHGRQGGMGRANGTFFSAQVVSTAFHHLRLALMDGAVLNRQGQRFVHGAAAYLAWLTHRNFRQRGLQLRHDIDLQGDEPRLSLHAWRLREGHEEHYRQHILTDVEALLLHPPNEFPALYGRFHPLASLTMPSPEYLYLYGVFLMQSARAEGNWPHGEQADELAGGLDADFELSRRLLIDDLHRDAGLPENDEVSRELSRWVVFPPCGWPMNEGQSYNMMALVDQIAKQPRLPAADGIQYLQALLTVQMPFVRHLAARTLMVLDIAPRTAIEAALYQQALRADDHQPALQAMARLRFELETPSSVMPSQWQRDSLTHWQTLIAQAPQAAWQRDPVLQEKSWQHASTLEGEHAATAMRLLQGLLPRYADSWLLRVAIAKLELSSPDSAIAAEATLRQCLETAPDCPEAHLALITHYHWQQRHDEATTLCRHAVARWPWDATVIDHSMWLLVLPMLDFPRRT